MIRRDESSAFARRMAVAPLAAEAGQVARVRNALTGKPNLDQVGAAALSTVRVANRLILSNLLETRRQAVREGVAFPDTCVGTDSHTPMVDALGVISVFISSGIPRQ